MGRPPVDLTKTASEQPSNPEEEFVMTRIAVGVGSFYRAENCVDDYARRPIGGEARCFVHHGLGGP